MKIINQTQNSTIAHHLIIPISLLDQSLGLLKYKTPQAMLLKTRFGIHTFGMRYPIDILILDNTYRVTVLKENLRPNRIFVWKPNYQIILELPSGTIKKSKTTLKDKVEVQK
jgi:uncharacterized protein